MRRVDLCRGAWRVTSFHCSQRTQERKSKLALAGNVLLVLQHQAPYISSTAPFVSWDSSPVTKPSKAITGFNCACKFTEYEWCWCLLKECEFLLSGGFLCCILQFIGLVLSGFFTFGFYCFIFMFLLFVPPSIPLWPLSLPFFLSSEVTDIFDNSFLLFLPFIPPLFFGLSPYVPHGAAYTNPMCLPVWLHKRKDLKTGTATHTWIEFRVIHH